MSPKQSTSSPIAIVGCACRLPGASTTPSKLADLLRQPRDVRREFNQEILNLKRFYDSNPDAAGSTNVKNKGYLLAEDTRVFDASFFNVSPYEAESMDPQLRVLMEATYEAFENAGYTIDQMRGSKTSVHVGAMASDYYDITIRDPETMPLYAGTGVARSVLSNRISYTFDLHGPSVTLDTACSSSLVALHQAVQGLQAGDATCAVVCGVNLIFDATLYVMLAKLHMLSPESLSRMWDKTVDGYARGEGALVVVLKPLDQALLDSDRIEGIIRGTGVNSDGQSPGLTMPTVAGQAALIRETYRRAGLDPVKDRCQYFECHGTGTPAGDPVESRAIYEAMIRDGESLDQEPTSPLYVGSIKSLVGHLEGGAGLAGLMKALLAIKHRTIFPNLWFNELNPKIEPYYAGFRVPTSALPWPQVGPGEPLRASVNSFGFGGTNAHAILESYEPEKPHESVAAVDAVNDNLSPFVISAHSAPSLLANCETLSKHLVETPSIDLSDLSWVLQNRRSAHRVRTFFTSQSREELILDLEKFVSQHEKSASKDEIGIRQRISDPSKSSRILGVFTGQGAQWPTMGRLLLRKSRLFRRTLEKCDDVLKALPDGPEWSLIEELSKDASTSRVGEAVISQPICTAVQLALIEVLTASSVHFDAVVGHSSGEIGAVYACGIINAAAAMQIAYYRGKYAHLAKGLKGEAGGMMAVGVDYETAQKFCQQPEYQDRLCVAASNAPNSVTLSGDLEAIQQAKEHFDKEQIFARLLKVDTAYHSHHMDRCVASYLESLRRCDIRVQAPRDGCLWVSSVYGNTELLNGNLSSLKGPYWVENMVKTVLFSPAVKAAVEDGTQFDLAIEIGPHPTLKGPTQQTLDLAIAASPPYLGTLKRGSSDVEAVSETIGSLWCHLGPTRIDFDGFRSAFALGKSKTPKLLTDLPPYAWDHDRVYWQESRISKNYRRRNDTRHPLLGRRVPDDTDREMRWRNMLRVSELPWTQGHVISGEVLLPGTSYVSLSCEAARIVVGEKSIRRIQVEDIEIRRPVIIPDTRQGLETTFTVTLDDSADPKIIRAKYSYYYSDTNLGTMVHACGGKIIIHLGEASEGDLPPYEYSHHGLHAVDSNAAYNMFTQNGLTYSGVFRRLTDVQRRLNYSVAVAEWSAEELASGYSLHPAVLDVCWQNLYHARADPRSGKLPTAILPTRIKSVTVNPNVALAEGDDTLKIRTESFITARNGVGVVGDVHIYNTSGGAVVQMESVTLEPLAPPTEDQDRRLFFDMVYNADPSLGLTEPTHDQNRVQRTRELSADLERTVLFYVQRVLEGIPPKERPDLTWYHQRLLESFESSVQQIREDRHPLAEKAWLADDADVIDKISSKWPGTVDMEMIHEVGQSMLEFLKRKESMLEVIRRRDLATRFYSDGAGLADVNHGMACVLEQISHKFPQARYVEIGAGTGSTTDYILRIIGNAFHTYTYTDISPAFFGEADERFRRFRGKTIFKTLDVEKDVGPQGFEKHAYDVVVASNVLHATSQLAETLKNARSLLKPGGFLLLVEITGTEIMRTTFCVGGLPGWWLGADEGRRLHPGLTTEGWHGALQDAGFSGVDLAFHDVPESKQHCLTFLTSQAVNDTVHQLREPLEYITDVPDVNPLVIVGGKTLSVSKTVNAIQRLAGPVWNGRITIASNLEDIDLSRVGGRADFMCLQELDSPLFSERITPRRLKALQTMMVTARNVLWLTANRRTKNPQSNMMVGMARAITKELPHVNMQFLDLESIASPPFAARTILGTLLRLKVLSVHKHDDDPILWLQEPELLVEGSDTLIPRVRPDKHLNDRYNARFRNISKAASGSDTCIGITIHRDKLGLTESVQELPAEDAGRVKVRVRYSLSIPGGKEAPLYLCIGQLIDSDTPVVAVSERITSIISVPRGDIAPIDGKDCNAAVLEGVADHIAVTGLPGSVRDRGSALLFNPRASLAACFASEFRLRGLEPLCASSHQPVPQDWISIHPHASMRAIQSLLPQDIGVYLDGSVNADLNTTPVESALPASCKTYQWDSKLFKRGLASAPSTQAGLKTAYASFIAGGSDVSQCGLDILNIEEIVGKDVTILGLPHIIAWETDRQLSLRIQPPDTTVLFDSAKTYLMIGMAGGLGLSVCGWALQHGAKHLVIASRKPNIDPQWLAHARKQGAEIHVRSIDAADRASLESTISNIRKTMPPLGGVCNAAMVLSDKVFVDLDVNAVTETFKPKVDVSKYLYEILVDKPLDFFIMFSSALSITGSQGSSDYGAANLFMTALAAQRRQNGKPASVIHVGYVTDVGYFTRASSEYVERLKFAPLSETDIHHAFAEAIIAGRSGSERSCEVGVGLEPFNSSIEGQEPAWLSDPLFSHFVPTASVHDEKDDPQTGRDSVKKQLQDAETEVEVVTVVKDALCAKIEAMLLLSSGSVDANALLTELGIDSLVAVDIRAWLLKNVGVEVSVMKILGGSSVAQICVDTSKEIMATKGGTSASNVGPEPETTTNSVEPSESSTPEATRSGNTTPPSTENESIAFSCDNIAVANKTEDEHPRVDVEFTAEPAPELNPNIIHMERMSAAQSRIYVLSGLMNDPTAYSLMIRYDIEDDLDIERLRNALTTTMQHHECLRTCFFVRREDNQPTQGVLSFPVRRFKHVPNATEEQITEELAAAKNKVWDIEHGETLSLSVLSRDSRTHAFVLGYHHIIFDASGMRRFISDLNAAYDRRPLKMGGGSCVEFARREQEHLQSGKLNDDVQYWRQKFTPLPDVLPLLPMAKTTVRPDTRRVTNIHASCVVEEDTVSVVKQTCQALGITPFQFYMAVIQVLLAQSLAIDDLCIGVADANREDEYMDTVGFFLNLVPVRFRIPSKTTFAEVAKNTARQIGLALEKSVPFDILLDQLNIARSSSHTPLFQVLVNYRLAMTKNIPFGNGSLAITDAVEGENPYDVTFSFLESQGEDLGITMDCLESLYDADGTEKLLDMYIDLLKGLARNINAKVEECQIYDAGAVSEALSIGQGERRGVGWPKTVSEKFQAICLAHTKRVAVRDRSSELTYQQLAARVNSIAAALHASGHRNGSRIAVLCEPSNDFVAALLAILHIGAIYVPVDVSFPSSRHVEIISSCNPGLVLYHGSTRELVETLVLESPGSLHALGLEEIDDARDEVPCTAQPNSPAFLLYTSGTTGKPKGVVLHQSGMVNWLTHTIEKYNLDAVPGSVLQQSSLGFDMSLIQIFCALCSGSTLVTVPQESRRDPSQIARLMHEHDITWTFAVPSEYLLWLRFGRDSMRQCKGWRFACIGGEPFPVQFKHEIRRLGLPNLSVNEYYGPTEITFTATSRPVPINVEEISEVGSPIGKTHPNYSICIIDASCRPLPIGFRGEICIGGTGVALGYWDMPVEADRRFIPDPTSSSGKEASANRWYRTGDQGRLAPDGTVMFLGRLGGDTQVKLRGQRIELAEVEGALLKSGESLLSTAVVTVRDGDLLAHVIPNRGKHIDGDMKRRLLTGLRLPQYMHPARVIVVDDLPRASTGKIDRQAVMKLPLLTSGDGGDESRSDLSLREVELKLLWSRVLPDPTQVLTAESDFFLEGGNSLRLAKLQNEIKETLGVAVSTRELYAAPTLRQMAARIGSESADDGDLDWTVETAIPDSLKSALQGTSMHRRTPKGSDLKVLLTGATGVLGNYVLHELLQNPAVAEVHCIAVTPEDEERIPTSKKVTSYPGSLSSQDLGLSPSECTMLQANMDVVVHAGANGHCLNSYSSIRKPNVKSTHLLASLCLPRSIPLLYVSSQRVPALAGMKVLPPVPVLAEPDKTGDTGYMASRWVSERFLHKLSEYNNIPIEIHRPCLFFGDRAPPSDALNGVLRYTRIMRAIPRFTKVEGYVDVKDVDEIARDVVSSAIALAGQADAGIRYRHHSSGRKVPFDKWAEYMEELTGEPFELLELDDWIARARKAGIHSLIATYLEGVIEKEELGLFPYLGEDVE